MRPGFFDHRDRLELLEQLGDSLPMLERTVDWQGFRALLGAVRTEGRFFRLLSWMTLAYRSPNTPINFDAAVKPGKAKSACIDLGFFMALAQPKDETVFSCRSMGESTNYRTMHKPIATFHPHEFA